MATAAHMLMIVAPIDQEHWLTECHHRSVVGEGNQEAIKRAQNAMKDVGYTVELPQNWSDLGTPGGSP